MDHVTVDMSTSWFESSGDLLYKQGVTRVYKLFISLAVGTNTGALPVTEPSCPTDTISLPAQPILPQCWADKTTADAPSARSVCLTLLTTSVHKTPISHTKSVPPYLLAFASIYFTKTSCAGPEYNMHTDGKNHGFSKAPRLEFQDSNIRRLSNAAKQPKERH